MRPLTARCPPPSTATKMRALAPGCPEPARITMRSGRRESASTSGPGAGPGARRTSSRCSVTFQIRSTASADAIAGHLAMRSQFGSIVPLAHHPRACRSLAAARIASHRAARWRRRHQTEGQRADHALVCAQGCGAGRAAPDVCLDACALHLVERAERVGSEVFDRMLVSHGVVPTPPSSR
jgi:hypothetical protein